MNCRNLTGPAVCGNNVTDMSSAYYNCINLAGNAYLYSPNINRINGCFAYYSKRMNVFVIKNSKTWNTIVTGTDYLDSIIYENITWTNRSTYIYNSKYSIYIYPVENVAASYEANENSNNTCCFVAGTQVLTSLDGKTKNIEDLSIGDTVVSYNVLTDENYLTEVYRVIIKENTTDIAEVVFDNGTIIKMNAYHPLYCENGFHSITCYNGYDELVVGDKVKTIDGWSYIVKINRYISDPIITYTIDVHDINENLDDDTFDTYYANGIVAKNPLEC